MLLDGANHIAWISKGVGRLGRLSETVYDAPEAFETNRARPVDAGASDGTVNDFGTALSLVFRASDGLEGEVLVRKR